MSCVLCAGFPLSAPLLFAGCLLAFVSLRLWVLCAALAKGKKETGEMSHEVCDWGHGLQHYVVGCGLWAVGWCLWCVCYRSRERSTWSSAAILSKSRKQSHSHRGPELSPLALCLTPTRHDRAAGLCSSTLLRGYRYIAALGSYHHSFFIANARTATRTHQPTANAFQPII